MTEITMTRERAFDILAHVAHERLRWGHMYDIKRDSIRYEEITEAIVVAARELTTAEAVNDLRVALALANRQLAAAKAREAKLRKQLGVSTPGHELSEEEEARILDPNQ